jgi:hypothetical protein
MENIKNVEIIEDLRQSEEYAQYMRHIGWKVLNIPNPKIQLFLRKIGPVGIVKIQRTRGELPLDEIEKKLKENHVMMCKLEIESGSVEKFNKFGYRLSSWPLLGTKTLRVDLKPNEDEIFKSFKKDCRYVLRKVISGNFEVQKNNFELFYEIWMRSAKRKGLWIPSHTEYLHLIESFDKNIFCITIGNEAGALVLLNKKTAFYYYAGATESGNKSDLPYRVVWECMKEAKKKGCGVWDFEGIFDSRWSNNGWRGFSHFKKSFGGWETEFPGSYEKWRWPF